MLKTNNIKWDIILFANMIIHNLKYNQIEHLLMGCTQYYLWTFNGFHRPHIVTYNNNFHHIIIHDGRYFKCTRITSTGSKEVIPTYFHIKYQSHKIKYKISR